MNDFTKEELEELSFWLTRLAMMENKMDKLKPIHLRIQSMIDNYCEHDNLDGYDLFLPKVGAILTDEKKSEQNKLQLIKNLYLRTVWPEKVESQNDYI